jgi:hypothetical protein
MIFKTYQVCEHFGKMLFGKESEKPSEEKPVEKPSGEKPSE